MSTPTIPAGPERRFIPGRELRAETNGSEARLTGYGAVFNSWSELLYDFREQILPGAFTAALGTSDVRFLVNHGGLALARYRGGKSQGTMTLTEDRTGLAFDATLDASSPEVQSLVSAINRGDIDGCSFAFSLGTWEERKTREKWEEFDGVVSRTILSVAEIYDVGPVTFPAYADTSVATRSLVDAWRAENGAPSSQGRSLDLLRRKLDLEAAL